FNQINFLSGVIPSTGTGVLGAITVNLATAGNILFLAEGYCALSITAGQQTTFYLYAQIDAGQLQNFKYVTTEPGASANTTTKVIAENWLFTGVSAGSHTFHLVGQNSLNAAGAGCNGTVTVLFSASLL